MLHPSSLQCLCAAPSIPRFFILVFLLHVALHPMGAYSEEHLLPWEDICVWVWHLWQDFALFFFCLLVQPDSLLFCLKWDKPRCFPSFTLTAAGFPGLRDLSLHSCTCFLLFLAPPLPCLLVPIYFPFSLSQFIWLFLLFAVRLRRSDRLRFPLFPN